MCKVRRIHIDKRALDSSDEENLIIELTNKVTSISYFSNLLFDI